MRSTPSPASNPALHASELLEDNSLVVVEPQVNSQLSRRSVLEELRKLKPQLVCAISNTFLQNPMLSTECGHVFSKDIIDSYIASGNTNCPVVGCNKLLILQNSRTLKDLLDVLEVNESNSQEINENNLLLSLTYLDEIKLVRVIEILTCPISRHVFLEPVILSTCGHSYEKEMLISLATSHSGKECTICRKSFELTDAIKQPGLEILIYALTVSNKDVLAEQYLSLKIGLDIIDNWDVNKVEQLIRQIIHNPSLINDTNIVGGQSNAYFLFMLVIKDSGFRLLKDYPELVALITPEMLNKEINMPGYQGYSLLYLLCCFGGIELLDQHEELRNKIDFQIFHKKVAITGLTPCEIMCVSESGLDLLKKDSRLRDSITSPILNNLSPYPSTKNASLLFLIVRTIGGLEFLEADERIQSLISPSALFAISQMEGAIDCSSTPLIKIACSKILANNLTLRKAITADALNYMTTAGKLKGSSAIFFLAFLEEGQKILLADPELRDKIYSDTLNKPFEYSDGSITSPLFRLLGTGLFFNYLDEDSNFRAKITAEGLNFVTPSGELEGLSPLSFLAGKKTSKILLKHPELIAMITSNGLATVSKSKSNNTGLSVLFMLLINPDFFNLLYDNEIIRSKVTKKAFQFIATSGENQTLSVLYQIIQYDRGIQLLINDERLRSYIDIESLSNILELSDQYITPLHLMCNCAQGLELLDLDANLRNMITVPLLNTGAVKGKFIGMSPLSFMLRVSLKLIIKYPELRSKISAEGLSQTSDSAQATGYTPLSLLVMEDEGLKLLIHDNELREKVTIPALNYFIRKNEPACYSVLFYIAANIYGREIIIKDKSFREKISSESLCHLTDRPAHPHSGVSPLFFLCAAPNARQVIRLDLLLRSKITSEALNYRAVNHNYKTLSPLLYLSLDVGLFASDPILRSKITGEGLENYSENTGFSLGGSVMINLFNNEAGLKMLAEDDELRNKISSKALNYIACAGDSQSLSVLYAITCSKLGVEIIKKDSRLRELITSESLCKIALTGSRGKVSALFNICKQEDATDIFADEEFRSKITAEALNFIYQDEIFSNVSPLLMVTCKLLHILIRFDDLRNKISPEALETSSTSKNCLEFFNPLMLICYNEEGQYMLSREPDLRNKITPKALNNVIPAGDNKGFSALMILCTTRLGIEILERDSQLRNKISVETMLAECSGQTALNYLLCTEKGRILLVDILKDEKLQRLQSLRESIPAVLQIELKKLNINLDITTNSIENSEFLDSNHARPGFNRGI